VNEDTQHEVRTTNVDKKVDHAEGSKQNGNENVTETGQTTAGTSHGKGSTNDTKTEDNKTWINEERWWKRTASLEIT